MQACPIGFAAGRVAKVQTASKCLAFFVPGDMGCEDRMAFLQRKSDKGGSGEGSLNPVRQLHKEIISGSICALPVGR